MVVVAHRRVGRLVNGEDIGQLLDVTGDPFPAMIVALAGAVVFTTEKGPAHTAGDAMVPERIGQADKGGVGIGYGWTPLLWEKAWATETRCLSFSSPLF